MLFLTEGAGTAPQGGGILSMLIPILMIVVVFYFMLMRPEKKRKKEAENMRNALKVGDVITTIGGITGEVVSISDKEDKFVIETSADRVRIEFYKWALSSNDSANAAAKAAYEKQQEERAKAKAAKKNKTEK